jgi:hypothetical protein
MAKKLSKAGLAVLVCLVISMAVGGEKTESAKKLDAENAKPAVHRSVVVEAYLVQIPAQTLRDAGVSVIPSKPEQSISIPKLLSCMIASKEKGALIGSTRVVARDNEEAVGSIQNSYNLKRTVATKSKKGTEESWTIHQSDSETTITVRAHVQDDALVCIVLDFHHKGPAFDMAARIKEGVPPDMVDYQLTETFDIQTGRAVIAGSAQSGDTSLFLVVRAEILK